MSWLLAAQLKKCTAREECYSQEREEKRNRKAIEYKEVRAKKQTSECTKKGRTS